MSLNLHKCVIFITLFTLVTSQSSRGTSNTNEQDRLRCLGVQCTGSANNNRLSRPAPGLGSSLSQPFASPLIGAEEQNPTEPPSAAVPVPSFCYDRAETGRCRAYFPRFFYNRQTGRCQGFVYGGCGGNRNSFKTEQECRTVCSIPIEKSKSGFDVGKEPNPPVVINTPDTSENPQSTSPCDETPLRGPCFLIIPRYYYNKERRECRRFRYSGCGGSQNNFKSKSSCSRTCENRSSNTNNISPGAQVNANQGTSPNNRPAPPMSGFAKGAPPPPPAFCLERVEPGPCFALFPRFYFDVDTKQCRSFDYGGCGGNRNNFESMASCKRNCDYYDYYTSRQSNGINIQQGSTADISPAEIPDTSLTPESTPKPSSSLTPEICLLPKKIGPCRALMPRFFYNSESGRCEQFGFGGCQENENNFRSERDCKRKCILPKSSTVKLISDNNNNNVINNVINNEVNSFLPGQLSQFNPVDSAAFREYLRSQQTNNDVDFVRPVVSSVSYVCALPIDPGTCTFEHRRYYYNTRTQSCQPFIFHGCGGNQNRFSSLAACQSLCMRGSSAIAP